MHLQLYVSCLTLDKHTQLEHIPLNLYPYVVE